MKPRTTPLAVAAIVCFAAGQLAACSAADPVGIGADAAELTAPTGALRPTSDVTKDHVVGVTDTSALFHDVDDTTSDDDATYVRGEAGVASTSHTTGYVDATTATTPVSSVDVVYRASKGTATGTAQVFLYDGATLIGSGRVNTLGSWATYSETFTGLAVARADTLRTKLVLQNTAGSGALRYTQIWLQPNPGASTSDAGAESGAGTSGVVDASTMTGKVMFGYQGWFGAPGDGSPPNRWWHWFSSNTADVAHVTVEMWPDTRELGADELFATSFTMPSGSKARLYSAYPAKTVDRHFRWMKDAGIDGVMLQRFLSESGTPYFDVRNHVTESVMAAAANHGRTFTIMYDTHGMSESTWVSAIQNDWMMLVDTLKVTGNGRYLSHLGRPLVAIYGIGRTNLPGTAAQARALVDWFHSGAAPRYRATVMAGVCAKWRTRGSGCKPEVEWDAAYRSFDVILPWSVGNYGDEAGADSYKANDMVPDLSAARAAGRELMPVIWPGFSWSNKTSGAPFNHIPRSGGKFYWRQAYNAVSAGVGMIYVAMFDEVDEGTAMFKVAENKSQVPAQGTWLTLDVDGYKLPSDWYLRLGGASTRMLRKEIPLTSTIPIAP